MLVQTISTNRSRCQLRGWLKCSDLELQLFDVLL